MTIHLSIIPNDDEIASLRTRFVDLFQKLCYMRDTEATVLNDLYTRYFGQLRINISILEGEVRALRLKTDMMQAAINRDEKPNILQIEETVRKKFEEYFQNLRNLSDQLKKKEPLAMMDEDDAKKLADLHRVLVKRLHPDIHPNQTEKEKDLFLKAQAAYDLRDIATLERILISLDLDTDTEVFSNEKESADYKVKIEKQIANLEMQIADLNSRYPFTFREKLSDREWVDRETADLENRIQQLTIQKEKFELRYKLQKEYFGIK